MGARAWPGTELVEVDRAPAMASATTSESPDRVACKCTFPNQHGHMNNPPERDPTVHPSGRPDLPSQQHPGVQCKCKRASSCLASGQTRGVHTDASYIRAGRFASRHAVRARARALTGPAGERRRRTDHGTGIWPRRRARARPHATPPRILDRRLGGGPKKAVAADDDVRAVGRARSTADARGHVKPKSHAAWPAGRRARGDTPTCAHQWTITSRAWATANCHSRPVQAFAVDHRERERERATRRRSDTVALAACSRGPGPREFDASIVCSRPARPGRAAAHAVVRRRASRFRPVAAASPDPRPGSLQAAAAAHMVRYQRYRTLAPAVIDIPRPVGLAGHGQWPMVRLSRVSIQRFVGGADV